MNIKPILSQTIGFKSKLLFVQKSIVVDESYASTYFKYKPFKLNPLLT